MNNTASLDSFHPNKPDVAGVLSCLENQWVARTHGH